MTAGGGGTNVTRGGQKRPRIRSLEQRLLALAFLGVLLGGLSTALVYGLSKPAALVVTDGSLVGTIEGNFPNYTSGAPLVLNLTATTWVKQTEHPISNLALRLDTWTFYDPLAAAMVVNVNLSVRGIFASDLRPGELLLVCNLTGQDMTVSSEPWFSEEVNVTPPEGPGIVLGGNGSSTQTIPLVGAPGTGTYFEFVYSEKVMAIGRYWSNHFLGFRAALAGLGAPVGVGILLRIIDVPGGMSS